MADNPKGKRDLVRFQPNERVDLPDIQAVQDNGRSESRMLLHNFIFGHGAMGLINKAGNAWEGVAVGATDTANTILAAGLADSKTNFTKNALCNSVVVNTDNATAKVTIIMNYWESFTGSTGSALGGGPLTGGFGGIELQSSEKELGSAVGTEGDDSQTLSMSGQPTADYGVYIGSVQDSGSPASRVFWDSGTSTESAQSINTRKIPGWNAKIVALSGASPPPHEGYQLIYVFHWDGSAFTKTKTWQNLLFEGITGAVEPFAFGTSWGAHASVGTDVYGNRSDNRFINGVSCWQDWAAALRSQLRDIIGDADGTGTYGWWTGSAKFTGAGGSSSWTGERSSLKHAQAHIETSTDPHGTALTQTDLDVTGTFEVKTTATKAYIETDDIQLKPNTNAGQIVLGNKDVMGVELLVPSSTALTGGFVTSAHSLQPRKNNLTDKPQADKILSAQWLFTNTLGGYSIRQARSVQLNQTNITAGTYNSGGGKRVFFDGGGEECEYMELRSMADQLIYDPAFQQEGVVLNIDLNMLFSWAGTTYSGKNTFVKLEAYCAEDLASLPAGLQASTTDQMFTTTFQTRTFAQATFTDSGSRTVFWKDCPATGLGTPITLLEAADLTGTSLPGRNALLPNSAPSQMRIRFEVHNGGSSYTSQTGNRIYFLRLVYDIGANAGG